MRVQGGRKEGREEEEEERERVGGRKSGVKRVGCEERIEVWE